MHMRGSLRIHPIHNFAIARVSRFAARGAALWRHVRRPVSVLMFTLLLSAFCWSTASPSRAMGIGQQFNEAYREFHSLAKDTKRKRFRSHWEDVEALFNAVYSRNPKGEYAPKALYYNGRVYEEMGAVSFVDSDYAKAVDYYHRAAERFPTHTWIDDCLYRAGVLLRDKLDNPAGAHRDFLAVVREHPDGDMRERAQRALNELDATAAQQQAAAPRPRPVSTADGPAHLDMIRYRSSDDYTRVVLEMDHPVEYVYKFLDPIPEKGKGHRVYIDLRNARMGADIDRNVRISDGILRGYRVGQNDAQTTRVVLDLLKYQDHKVFHLDNPFRIVVDVYSPDKPPSSATAQQSIPEDAAKRYEDVDPQDLVKVLGLTIKTVMIDAGHGAHDKGAAHNGLYEKDINLTVAKEVGALLEKEGFHVLYTRTDDTFVPLEERTAMANMSKVDLFLSLHCNAFRKSSIRGFETYSLSLKSSSEQARRVAARENGVQPHQISDLQFILADLVLNSKVEESSDLAEDIQRNVVRHVRGKYGIRDHGHRHAPFYVLMGAKMPAVLVEMGYLTNRHDAANLGSAKYRRRIAEGIVKGVLAYKKRIESFAMN
ncbi:N-acetylmuramoyl-L-alanine amidase [Paucidesulfovibrio gracilis]|nr:N-acetylmuramoyl-L-alanine amidase [Paucidesulfovibrio gracilis]